MWVQGRDHGAVGAVGSGACNGYSDTLRFKNIAGMLWLCNPPCDGLSARSSVKLCPTAAPRCQVLRYTFPFMFISAVFWLLHTWLLDPMPNGFRRQEFLRYRRELMHVASKLNFRWVARATHL